jgi:hypothetical protein
MEEAVRLSPAEPARVEADESSLTRCEHVLELLLTHRGKPLAEVNRVLADDPQCVFGHCLRAALIVCADDAAARSSLAASVAAIEAACREMHDPARRHAAAARAWLEGDPALAAECYGAIVIDWPRDILALVVAQTLDFHLGHRRLMRVRIAQVLTKWETSVPGYASVLAMYAFALEENGQYRRAEKVARSALVLDPPTSRRYSRRRPCDGDAGAHPRRPCIPCRDRIGMDRRYRIFSSFNVASRALPS